MPFYDDDSSWSSASGRQSSWEHQQPGPPSRSTTASSLSQHNAEPNAFAAQFEEIDRATDNLMKSGKWMPGVLQPPTMPVTGGPARRESMPNPPTQAPSQHNRNFEYGADPRSAPPQRHQSVSEFEGGAGRPNSAGLQGYYAGQRFPGGRQSEAEQVLQAKRRMAAQRERELRNYHQEQQYNRTSAVSGNSKPDRAMSPGTMSEEDRRDLIARQHRALYGDTSNLYHSDAPRSRSSSQDVRVPSATSNRGPSPLAFDPFHPQSTTDNPTNVQMPPRDRPDHNLISPPPPNTTSNNQQQPRTTTNPQTNNTTTSPPLNQGQQIGTIGTRPPPGVAKRSTTPLGPSGLNYTYSATGSDDVRKTSNPAMSKEEGSSIQVQSQGSGSGGPGEKNGGSGNAGSGTQGAAPGLGGKAWGAGGVGAGWGGKGVMAVQGSVWG